MFDVHLNGRCARAGVTNHRGLAHSQSRSDVSPDHEVSGRSVRPSGTEVCTKFKRIERVYTAAKQEAWKRG